jgi:hypothetical protein
MGMSGVYIHTVLASPTQFLTNKLPGCAQLVSTLCALHRTYLSICIFCLFTMKTLLFLLLTTQPLNAAAKREQEDKSHRTCQIQRKRGTTTQVADPAPHIKEEPKFDAGRSLRNNEHTLSTQFFNMLRTSLRGVSSCFGRQQSCICKKSKHQTHIFLTCHAPP